MEKITLSIFVPCFNEENNITKALNNIKEGIQHISYEVLVVDDASEELSPSFAQPLKIRPAVSSMMTLKWRNILFFILILGSGYDLLMKK